MIINVASVVVVWHRQWEAGHWPTSTPHTSMTGPPLTLFICSLADTQGYYGCSPGCRAIDRRPVSGAVSSGNEVTNGLRNDRWLVGPISTSTIPVDRMFYLGHWFSTRSILTLWRPLLTYGYSY